MKEERFRALWYRCLANGKATDPRPVYADLIRRYAEPQRYYHNVDHISHCLSQLDLVKNLVEEPNAVEMALWFHDAIYDPRASDNELKSAELFMKQSRDCIAPDFNQNVYELILITIHQEPPQRLDEMYMVDIDLSGFGLSQEAFKRDNVAIRKEYAHIPDEIFLTKKLKFAQALLDRPTLYFTDFFRERYERAARENINRLMKEMQAQGFVA